MDKRYPALHHFLSTEFIQDSEDDRPLDEIATGFAKTYGPAKAATLAAEIHAFLAAHPHDLEAAFARFEPMIDPAADGHTVKTWLQALATHLH